MNRESLFRSVSVIDTETTNLHAEEAEIVEVAASTYNGSQWQSADMLLGAKDGIPPEASAKNNISNRMIADKPLFANAIPDVENILRWPTATYWVAHNAPYDQEVLAKAWLEVGRQKDAMIALNKKRWICTFRLAKHLLDFDFPNMQYNLSFLRYKLELPVPDDMGVHRAGADTLVCAALFELLVDYALATDRVTDSPDLGTQINQLCWSPIAIKNFPFGKYRGKPLAEIPNDYYKWALANLDSLNDTKKEYDEDLASSIAVELERRFAE